MPQSAIDAVPSNEEGILQSLINIRSQLSVLKKNRSSYIKSSDVTKIYEELIPQIKKINDIRSNPALQNEHNRLDVVLDDVFQLLSLAFMTVGLTRAVPATFASLSTVHRLLQHLKESKIYSDNDTKPIHKRLDEIQEIVNANADSELPEIVHLIKNKLKVCKQILSEVEDSMKTVAPELQPILRKLVTIRREILSIGSKPKFSASAFKPIKKALTEIENKRVDGEFVAEDGSVVEQGQGVLNGLLEECHNFLNDFTASAANQTGANLPKELKPAYDELVAMKSKLESLLVTHRWTLRETDLYTYQKKLHEIDELREGPEFAELSKTAPKLSSITLYLLRRCYAILYKLLESSEPVSEALIPIHNQLSTVRRCLLEVQRMGGLSSPRELYPYQMKLASIDDLRVDGKFMVDGAIPEGQGMLNALLSECFDITHELRVQIQDKEEENEDDNDKEEDNE
ncbi:hypothetical protein DV495_002957 [Geotrichum candidum]|nr:hypothetical protein DV495_002957 [Geotrichum candidum]